MDNTHAMEKRVSTQHVNVGTLEVRITVREHSLNENEIGVRSFRDSWKPVPMRYPVRNMKSYEKLSTPIQRRAC